MSRHDIRTLMSSFNISEFSKIILDTNVLLFVHGGYSPTPQERAKYNSYSNFISLLISHNMVIFVSPLTLQELFHVIEAKEYKLYLESNSLNRQAFTLKQFRSNQILRANVKSKIQSVYQQIKSAYEILDYTELKKYDVDNYVSTYDTHKFDPMDYILTKSFQYYVDTYYLTDDKDFLSDSTLEVISY